MTTFTQLNQPLQLIKPFQLSTPTPSIFTQINRSQTTPSLQHIGNKLRTKQMSRKRVLPKMRITLINQQNTTANNKTTLLTPKLHR
jgi:hypothetical protein